MTNELLTNLGATSTFLDQDLVLLEALPTLDAEDQARAVGRLIRAASPVVRRAAARIGATILTDDEITRYLREEVDDMVRRAGLEMLELRGRLGTELAVSLLCDRDADVVVQAVLALDHLRDPRALEPLRQVLRHPSANVVQAAIVALGHLGHAGTAQDLLPLLLEDVWFQMAAIQALGDLRVSEAIEPLARLLVDDVVGALAADSLAKIGGPDALRCLVVHWCETGAEDDECVGLLAHLLEGMTTPPPVITGFREALARRMRQAETSHRMAAARCLLALGPGPDDGAALELMAQTTSGGASSLFPTCLARRSDLIGTLVHCRGALRSWGFQLAARHPESAPIGELAKSLVETRGYEHLEAVAEAMAVVHSQELGEAFLEFYLRLPGDARGTWGQVLHEHRDAVRHALSQRADVPAQTRLALTAMVEDAPDRIAAAIQHLPPHAQVEALAQIPRRLELVEELPWMRWLTEDVALYGGVAAQVAVAQPEAFAKYLPAVRDLLKTCPHPHLVRIVRDLKDVESIPVLIKLLDERDAALQPFLIGALGTFGGTEARQALRLIATSEEIQWARLAFTALADCSTPEDRTLFREAAAHADWYIRLSSATVLGRASEAEDQPLLMRLAVDPVAAVANRALAVLDA